MMESSRSPLPRGVPDILLRSVLPFLYCLALLACLTGCAKKRVQIAVPTTSSSSSPSLPPEEKVGYASWYGDPYHGRRTSNGETYNKYSMTAAHRTLPFDTLVKVNNLENGKKVKVRINDRGPFIENRIIDLSLAAAQEIDMVRPGTAKVSLEIIKTVPNPFPLAVQVAAFKEKGNAEKLKRDLQKRYVPVVIRKYESSEGEFFRVLVGRYDKPQTALAALKQLKAQNHDGLIVRLDQ